MFKINPNPTFKAKVEIPVPGGKPEKIEFVFKHKTKKQLRELMGKFKEMDDPEAIMEIAEGWNDVEDDFTLESLESLDANYHGASGAIITTYLSELTQAKVKN